MAGIVTAAVATVATTAFSAYQQSRAASKQRKANRKAQRIEAIQAQRERVQAVRQNRIAASQAQAQAGNSGLLGSSGIQGGIAALQTQAASNLSFTNQIDALNTQRQGLLESAQGNLKIAGISDAIGGLVTQGVSSGVLKVGK